ncbi:13447_t:CDS:2 [Acaulospora colombiana]|uniref:13447_t:CDS:1 n=1 Tax=Acaulospora colombiana TaxID=27376 RepID=A0ACA9M4P6_9GLOM|nr:13447_t:CDS:2 [Acaulospora colombiana]
MFQKYFDEGQIHLAEARRQKIGGFLYNALYAYEKAIKNFETFNKFPKSLRPHLTLNTKELLAEVYVECGNVFMSLKEIQKAEEHYRKALKWKNNYIKADEALKNLKANTDIDTTSSLNKFFFQNPRLNLENYPVFDDKVTLADTRQLAYYLQKDIQSTLSQEQICNLKKIASDVIEEYAHKISKSRDVIQEAVILSSIPDRDIYKKLLEQCIQPINNNIQVDSDLLEGLTQVVQNAQGHLDVGYANGLVQILGILTKKLQGIHQQQGVAEELYILTRAISRLLDAMKDVEVKGLDRESLHAPLYKQLSGLSKNKEDPALSYQAKYACQALLYVPDNEQPWQSAMRHFSDITGGILTLASAAKNLDPSKLKEVFSIANGIIEELNDFRTNFQDAFEGLKEIRRGFKFKLSRHRPWYIALRHIDFFIYTDQLVELEEFVRKTRLSQNPEFLWGFCQRIENLVNTHPDITVRQNALGLLKDVSQYTMKWGRYGPYPQIDQLSTTTFVPDFPTSLLYAAQSRSPVEANLKKLKKEICNDKELEQLLNLYIEPRGKLDVQDTDSFSLFPKVKEFLQGPKNVLLLLGDSGAGKSTFNRFLSLKLWEGYKVGGLIPLYISLTTIKNPKYDLIEKHLRKEFSEDQIKELKRNRKFVFILDGYDEIGGSEIGNICESNQLEAWNAHIIVMFTNTLRGILAWEKLIGTLHSIKKLLTPFLA